MKDKLSSAGLSPNNSVIIGSGVLSAFGIRASKDIDVVTNKEAYSSLKKSGLYEISKNHGEVLLKDGFEIRTSWEVIGKNWVYKDLLPVSVVIDGVRYITPEFLLKAKRSWIKKNPRLKDLKDIELLENYLKVH